MTYNVAHVTADPEIQLLNRLGGLFSASLSLNDNIEAMLRATSQMVQFDAATVFLLNEGSRELTATATYPHRDMVPHIARFVLGEQIDMIRPYVGIDYRRRVSGVPGKTTNRLEHRGLASAATADDAVEVSGEVY